MESKIKYLDRHTYLFVLFGCVYGLLFSACETEFIPANIALEPEIVVEGYIELADDALPPYVILTRSRPFFTDLNQAQLNDLFIKNADVSITVDNSKYKLTELCLNDLPPAVKEQVAKRLGLNPDSLTTNLCVYTDIAGQIVPAAGKTYRLDIKAGNQSIEAITTIPFYIPLDSIWWKEAPGIPSDTLLQLFSKIKEPGKQKNFYRYFCGINDGELITPFNSVYDDALIDGKVFEFRLLRPNAPGEEFDQSTFGLFRVGDSIVVKWSTIDQAHFNFWNTFEFNQGNQGPFSTYTTIDTNIKGGLGIWGGYNSRVYRLKVKR